MAKIRNNSNTEYMGIIYTNPNDPVLVYARMSPRESWTFEPEQSQLYIESGLNAHQSNKICDLTKEFLVDNIAHSKQDRLTFESKLKEIIEQK